MNRGVLSDIEIEADEAQRLFEQVLFDVERQLELGRAHGVLSALRTWSTRAGPIRKASA